MYSVSFSMKKGFTLPQLILNCTNYKVPHCEVFFISYSHTSYGPNIRVRIRFSNNISLHSSLNVRNHVSHPYSTTGYIYIYIYIINKLRTICKGWILDPMRTMLRTKLSQRNRSPLTLHNKINIALFTVQNTYALLVGLMEGFS